MLHLEKEASINLDRQTDQHKVVHNYNVEMLKENENIPFSLTNKNLKSVVNIFRQVLIRRYPQIKYRASKYIHKSHNHQYIPPRAGR